MLKIKKGLTLIEVIVSIALLGILAVVFLPALSGHFIWLKDTKINITQKAFEAQDSMEITIQEVVKAMKSGTIDIDPDDYTSLGITDKIEVKLFTSKFSSYTTSRHYPSAYKVEVSDGANKKFVTLVGDKRLPELPVPVIKAVSRTFIKNGAEKVGTHEYFSYSTLKILAKSNMVENPQNSFNRYRSDWYVSKPGFLIPIQSVDIIDQDNDYGRIYPAFPDDYIALPIHSELGSSYSYVSLTERDISAELKNDIVNKYPGKHILYTITPFAKSLKMGVTSSLLPLYIYGPDVTDNLAVHFDASTINMIDTYNSTTNPNGSLVSEGENYYVKMWKNSRPSIELATINSYNAVQNTQSYMPILVKDSVYLKPEIPFQSKIVDGNTVYSVWGRALGNKPAVTSNANLEITGINTNINNDWSMFVVMRRVDAPLAPTSGPIIKNNSGTDWSLGWNISGSNYKLELKSSLPSTVTLPGVPEDWILVHAKSTSSAGTSLKAMSLKKGGTYSEIVSGTGKIDINDMNIVFNGVEIAEVLVYNTNMIPDNLVKIENYLLQKYNPD